MLIISVEWKYYRWPCWKITSIVGKGSVLKKEIPHNIKVIDIGNAKFSDNKLKKYLGDIPLTRLDESLSNTVNYFKETYHWFGDVI